MQTILNEDQDSETASQSDSESVARAGSAPTSSAVSPVWWTAFQIQPNEGFSFQILKLSLEGQAKSGAVAAWV